MNHFPLFHFLFVTPPRRDRPPRHDTAGCLLLHLTSGYEGKLEGNKCLTFGFRHKYLTPNGAATSHPVLEPTGFQFLYNTGVRMGMDGGRVPFGSRDRRTAVGIGIQESGKNKIKEFELRPNLLLK